MDSPLRSMFSRSALRRLAGGRSFERGSVYAATGRVGKLKWGDDQVSATVRGNHQYRVKLWPEDGAPAFSCTCPVGDDGLFCKHCVAVGLVAFDGGTDPALSWAPASTDTTKDLRAYLEAQDKDALVDLIVAQAENDDFLQGSLLLQAATAAGKPVGLDGYRRAIDRVIVVDDFVDYRSMYDYSSRVEEVIDSLEKLLEEGFAAETIGLAERALEAVEDALGRVDDSDGYMGGIRDRLVELHHAACQVGAPPPATLAERLFEWGLHSEWETFLEAGASYADVLGPEGLAAYRRLAEAVWALVPASGSDDERDHSGFRFRITYIMETLARLSGDADELVAVKARDLSHPYHYVQIAEILCQADRFDEALAWAERGLAAFPERTDIRLREVLADEYHRRGRHDQAMALIWAAFTESPGLGAYQRLHNHAQRANRWSGWRDRALDLLRQRAAHALNQLPPRWGPSADHSELVKVFLWEGDVEAAWDDAIAGGCSVPLWMELAALREGDHPADVLPIYKDHVERTIQEKNNRAYAEAVELLTKVRQLTERLGRSEEFPTYLASVRAAHKPKRNLMKLLDQAGRASERDEGLETPPG